MIQIEAGNAAASTTEDLARILRKTAERIEQRGLGKLEDGGKVMDSNGNAVGRWTWTPDN